MPKPKVILSAYLLLHDDTESLMAPPDANIPGPGLSRDCCETQTIYAGHKKTPGAGGATGGSGERLLGQQCRNGNKLALVVRSGYPEHFLYNSIGSDRFPPIVAITT